MQKRIQFLSEHLLDYMTMHIGQASLQTIVIKGKSFVVQAHEVKNRCIEIINRGLPRNRLKAKFVTLSITVGLLYSCTCKKAGEGVWVMITTCSIPL